MSAIPPDFSVPADSALAVGSARMKWTVLQDAAAVVATLAGVEWERPGPEIRDFPEIMRKAGGWRLRLAEQGIDDLAAIMEPGIEALLAVHGRGADASAPALALWQEFLEARAALLELAPKG